MKVFKFGGASVKDADAIKNLAAIVKSQADEHTLIVVSAMGKTTNALERLVEAFYYKNDEPNTILEEVKSYHLGIMKELFKNDNHPIYEEIHNAFVEIEWQIEDEPVGSFDFEYDQMVGIGELLSTKIIAAYLNDNSINALWMDVRDFIRTDNTYRNAKVDWEESKALVEYKLKKQLVSGKSKVVTQGFVGSSSENFSTTLGREGSDYTAAILANLLEAKEVVIWKDVDGMLNADPKYYSPTVRLNNISYREAVELAYYGASVIHPKTIKPLQNKEIPLWVKSFVHPDNKGSVINTETSSDSLVPSYIHKENQRLLSISPRDYSFIEEENLSEIFGLLFQHKIKVNMMQQSAISFSICVDENERKLSNLIEDLQLNFQVSFNSGLNLLTIRHYTEDIIDKLLKGKLVYLEQKTRTTARFVLKNN